MLRERGHLAACSGLTARRRQEEQFELGAELRVARSLAFGERSVDLSIERVVRVEYEDEPISLMRDGEKRRVLHLVLDDAVPVLRVGSLAQPRVALLQLLHEGLRA